MAKPPEEYREGKRRSSLKWRAKLKRELTMAQQREKWRQSYHRCRARERGELIFPSAKERQVALINKRAEKKAELRRLLESGALYSEIAFKFKYKSVRTARLACNRLLADDKRAAQGFVTEPCKCCGVTYISDGLDYDFVRRGYCSEMCAEMKNGVDIGTIARMFGFKRAAIYHWIGMGRLKCHPGGERLMRRADGKHYIARQLIHIEDIARLFLATDLRLTKQVDDLMLTNKARELIMANQSSKAVTTGTRLSWIEKGRLHKREDLVSDLMEALDGQDGYHQLVDERIRIAYANGDDTTFNMMMRLQRSLMEFNARLRGAIRLITIAAQEESPRRK